MSIFINTKVKQKPRFSIIDQARGLAVLLMFISHSIDFFYNGDLFWLDFLRWFTAVVSFTTFIYLSGASNYIASVDHAGDSEIWQKKKLHLLIKTLQLLAIYYALALFLSILNSYQASGIDYLSLVKDILLLRHIPTYTEFIITFIILNFSLVFFGRAYKFILKNSLAVLIVGLNVYILGMFFYQFDFGDELNHYKALFVGHDQGYRFPVFQYFPVYLFGMKFGRELLTNIKRFRISWVLQLLLLGLLTFGFAISKIWDNVDGEGFVFLQRWPPSISFLLVGIIFVQCVIIFHKIWNYIFNSSGEKITFLEFLGRNPLDFYVLHIILLELYKNFIGTKTASILLVFIGFSVLLVVVSTLVFLKLKFRFTPKFNLEKKINDIINQRFSIPMKHFYRLTALVLIVGAVALVVHKVDVSGGEQVKIETEGFVQGVSVPENVEWWNKDYKYYSEITIRNIDTDRLLAENSTLSINLDHKKLVAAGKSLESGEDLTVVYLADGRYEQRKVFVENPNTPNAQVFFDTVQNIAPESSIAGYYLYYGNKHPVGISVLDEVNETSANYEITLGEEQSALIVTGLSRTWYLKDYSKTGDDSYVRYKIQMTTSQELEDDDIVVLVSGDRQQQFAPSKIEDSIFELEIPLDILQPGEYNLKTIVSGKNYESDTLSFKVSYPLYVTWTIDWEGYDVSEDNLKEIRDISINSQMPLTTFFNPRIFIATDIPDHRKTRLVEWALQGKREYGDEIGLHLHMHQDMIAAAGLEPKTEPRWGGRENGHDVLTTAYEYEEYKTLVEWALQRFAENGLPVPISYRAGGWFMDEENLKVLDDLGFKIDSSGREAIKYGPNQIENPWNLFSTTRPYKPSVNDQNSTKQPTLNLWEFPNNGMDSTNRNYDILIEKFNDNYADKPLTETQVVTYLSHPHWFTQLDSEDMKKTFAFIDKYKYEKDQGAVVYVTLEGALHELEQ